MDFSGFLDKNNVFAVIGVSRNKEKFGYKVFKKLVENGFTTYAINPNTDYIDGVKAYRTLAEVPESIDVVVFVVKPSITLKVLLEVKKRGIKKVWLQPGSESKEAIEFCKNNNIACIYKKCIVVDGLNQSF